MKRLMMINTGGTFSSVESEHGLVPGIKGEEIKALMGGFVEECILDTMDYAAIDSANITPENWTEIATLIDKVKDTYDGVIVIHGTDVMGYTSSMLSFMLQNIKIPVILTGSQLPLNTPLTDAEDNLRTAIAVALTGIQGVFTVFNRKVMRGCRTSKVRTVSFDAFESVNYPLVGEFNAFGLNMNWALERPEADYVFAPHFSDKIAVLKLFPGMTPDIFDYLHEKGCEGVFVEGFGLGGVPFMKNNIQDAIARATDKGMTILVGSQCRYEGSNLMVYETGRRVLASGGIPVFDMTQEATVTKLMWCLGKTKKRSEILQLFATDLVGEVTLPRYDE